LFRTTTFKGKIMAISKTIKLMDNFNVEVTFQDCYIKVDSIVGNKSQLIATISYYKQKDGEKIKQQMLQFAPDLSGNNFIAQAYSYAKTLPEFAGAVDC